MCPLSQPLPQAPHSPSQVILGRMIQLPLGAASQDWGGAGGVATGTCPSTQQYREKGRGPSPRSSLAARADLGHPLPP